MADYTSESIRNIAILGHGGSGKTSLTEAILFTTGAINRLGKVEEGNTISDYHSDEIEKQISINSTVVHTFWKKQDGTKTKLNLIDCPGFIDYLGEVRAALRVTDTAVLMIDSFKGIEVGTELCFDYTGDYNDNVLFAVNKLDHENSNFFEAVKQIKESFGSKAAVVQFPVNEGNGFNEIIDVAKMKMLRFSTDGKGECEELDIPDEQLEKAKRYHQQFVEVIAEEEDILMEKFFEGNDLSKEEIEYGLKKGMRERMIFPIFCLCSTRNIGVRSLLDFISEYTESPIDKPSETGHKPNSDVKTEVPPDPDGEPVIFIFKTISERNIGELSFFRVFSGKVFQGLDLINEATGKTERLSQLYSMNGKDRKEMPEVICGDIAAVVKLKDTHTNNTLSSKGFPVVLNEIRYPAPNMTLAIVPKKKGDEDKIAAALHSLHEEDPTFIVSYNSDINQTLISGQGEMHLNTVINRMKNKFNLEVEVTDPRIPYRETIKGFIMDSEFKHKKQSGGRGQFGHVHLRIEPLPRGSGYEFVNAIVGGVVPGRFVPAVDKGVQETLANGVLAGCKVVDVKVTLTDGSYHTVDSDELSFKIAAAQAFKKGFREAKPVLLEPLYEVEVLFPEEFMGAVSADISTRRGKISGMNADGKLQKLTCIVPLSEMSGYSSKLRSLTQGRGTYTRKFSHYEEVPKEVETKIVNEYDKSRNGQ
jgi:elongation factor G